MDFLNSLNELSAVQAAPKLLGSLIERTIDGHKLVGRIVETEAYHQADPASHSFRGQTERNKVMFGPAGHLYVYFTYGMHYCANIVVGPVGSAEAVLIRALEPTAGEKYMVQNRPAKNRTQLTNGPAKWTQAFAVDKHYNGHDLSKPPIKLLPGQPVEKSSVVVATRIGIKQAVTQPWRFYEAKNPFVSRLS